MGIAILLLFDAFSFFECVYLFLFLSTSAPAGDNPPAEKKYKPLNTTPNTTKEIKVKIIPPQRKYLSLHPFVSGE